MKAPDKIYTNNRGGYAEIPIFSQADANIEYIRKDIVDETIKSAEDHAYFAGQEKFREKLLEWVKNKITEIDIAMDTSDVPAIWGQKNAFKQVLDEVNSILICSDF